MKKNLLSILFFTAVSVTVFAQVCTPDPTFVASGQKGIYPADGDPIASGTPGMAYEQTFTLVTPTDTMVLGFYATLDSIHLDSISGLPSGLSFACSEADCMFTGGTTGCFKISGTTSEQNTFAISLYVTPYGLATGTPLGDITLQSLGSQQFASYDLVMGNVGVQSLNSSKFDVIQNVPNPFSGSTSIKFNSPTSEPVNFYVFDMIGKQIHSSKINAVTGMNTINYTSEKLAPGAYFYTLANGKSRITKRMIVSGK